ncbi:MAG: S8 family serine peptidase, partial [Acidobacteriota bacterium]|nr:S8 family serine peptidase [Acidobacteriota bacterium]
MLNARRIDVKSEDAQLLRNAAQNQSSPGKRMRLVKFRGPIRPEWLQELKNAGLKIVDYIPNYAYLVYGEASSLQNLRVRSMSAESSPVEWEGEYLPQYRISPKISISAKVSPDAASGAAGDAVKVVVQLFKDTEENERTLNEINRMQSAAAPAAAAVRRWNVLHYINLVISISESDIEALSNRPDVISITPWVEPVKTDERQDLILTGNFAGDAVTPGNYLSYLTSKGFTQEQFDASNFVVNINDSGIDSGAFSPPNTAATKHFGLFRFGLPNLSSRVVYARLQGAASVNSTTLGCDGHGTINAHILAGYVPDGSPFNAFPHADGSGFRYGLGVVPFAKIGSSVIFDPNFTSPNLLNVEAEAYRDGARISTNSWGIHVNGLYDA